MPGGEERVFMLEVAHGAVAALWTGLLVLLAVDDCLGYSPGRLDLLQGLVQRSGPAVVCLPNCCGKRYLEDERFADNKGPLGCRQHGSLRNRKESNPPGEAER
jgi:hypothetical protein